jgi:hypothetical protein
MFIVLTVLVCVVLYHLIVFVRRLRPLFGCGRILIHSCVVWCGAVGCVQVRKYARDYQRRKVLREHEVLTSNPMMAGGGAGAGSGPAESIELTVTSQSAGGDSDGGGAARPLSATGVSLGSGSGSGSGGGKLSRDTYQTQRGSERAALPVSLQLRAHHEGTAPSASASFVGLC